MSFKAFFQKEKSGIWILKKLVRSQYLHDFLNVPFVRSSKVTKSKEQNFLKNSEKSMTNSIVWDFEKKSGNEKGHFCYDLTPGCKIFFDVKYLHRGLQLMYPTKSTIPRQSTKLFMMFFSQKDRGN